MKEGLSNRVYALDLPSEMHSAVKQAAAREGLSINRWILQTITPALVEGGYLRKGPMVVS